MSGGGASITFEVKSLWTTISVSLLNGPQLRYASIAICKASTAAPVAAIARSPCPTRVIKFVLFMCAYSLTDRTDNRMPRPPIHNKRMF